MEKLTPAMRQYMSIKKRYPDCIVLFRMGDFYETFYEDAKLAAETLEITLTARGAKNGSRVPLAGIPYHSLDTYLARLVKKGIKVVIVEQMEDPKLAKGVVKRDVVRIVTPGTIHEAHMLEQESNNFIAAVCPGEGVGLAFADISTGMLMATELKEKDILDELSRHSPSEVLLPSKTDTDEDCGMGHEQDKGCIDKSMLTEIKEKYHTEYLEPYNFQHDYAYSQLIEHFSTHNLKGFGIEGKKEAISASGALIAYLKRTQRQSVAHICTLNYRPSGDGMGLDHVTVRDLELLKNAQDRSVEGTLLSVLNRTRDRKSTRLNSSHYS